MPIPVHNRSNIRDLRILQGARGLAARGALAVCLVGCEVEGDEEEEVRGDDAHAGEGGEFFAGAVAGVGHPGPVGGSEVGVGGEVDEAWEEG